MVKVSIIGAGNVGATAAKAIINHMSDIKEVVLLDIKAGVAEGKAADIAQSVFLSMSSDANIIGVTSDYSATANSDIVVITSGVPRKPGMSREDLVNVNAKVVTSVLDSVYPQSPNAIYLIVSNPLDTMTYLTVKHLKGKVSPNKIIGMGGALDSSRFAYYLAKKANVPIGDIDNCYVIGGHGDKTMVPIVSGATIRNTDAIEVLSQEDLNDVVEETKKGGSTLTSLLGTSAWVAPGEAIACMVLEMVMNNGQSYIPCCTYREDLDVCIGCICRISLEHGVIGYVTEDAYSEAEGEAFKKSVEAVKEVNKALNLEVESNEQ